MRLHADNQPIFSSCDHFFGADDFALFHFIPHLGQFFHTVILKLQLINSEDYIEQASGYRYHVMLYVVIFLSFKPNSSSYGYYSG